MSGAPQINTGPSQPVPVPVVLKPLAVLMHWVNKAVVNVSMLALLAAAVVLTGSVFLRYFFKMPTDWQDEAAVFLLVGATFLCGAFVQAERGHVGIEAIASILPDSVNRFRKVLCDLMSFMFCSFFSWKSWTLLHEAWIDGQTTSSSWAPPLWIPYGLMALGMSLLAVQLFLQVMSVFASKQAGAQQ